MPALREQDFDKMAAHVVDQFLSGRAKLADAAAAQATEAGLNPDQIERLTQAANTMTFLRMMEDRKAQGASELTHEFDPIDARQVIRIVIDNAGVHVEPDPSEGACGADEPDEDPYALPDEMGERRQARPVPAPSEPKPEKESKGQNDRPPASPKEAELQIMRGRKLAAVLDDQLRQAAWTFEDTYERLAGRFRRAHLGVTYASFEKDALAEHGDEVGVHVLNLLRIDRELPALETEVALEKAGALKGHHVSEDSTELRLFETLVKVALEAHQLRRGLQLVSARCV